MTTTRYPQHWLTFTGNQEPESDPIHTLACECAGVDPNDTDADVLQVEDRTAVEAIQRAGNKAPGCDAAGNLDHGTVYAVCDSDLDFCRLVWVREGTATRV